MVPGPRGWCSVDDLHRLRRDFGFPHEFPDIEKEAMAAKLRVVAWEAEASGGIRCRDRVARIVDALNRAPHLGRVMRQGTWALESYAHVLQENEEQLNNKGISVQQVNVLAAGGHRPWTEVQTRRARMRFQRTAARSIRDAEPGRNVEDRLRLKLERWDVALFPRVRAIRASRVLQKLNTATPPRVLAAVLTTWFDGWCTMRRFGGIGSCVLCGRAEGDDLEHLPHCPEIRVFSVRGLGLAHHDQLRERTADFLLLGQDATDVLTLKAIRLAAAYQVHCASRREPGRLRGVEVAYRALVHAAKELVSGHGYATRAVDDRWRREGAQDGMVRRVRRRV